MIDAFRHEPVRHTDESGDATATFEEVDIRSELSKSRPATRL